MQKAVNFMRKWIWYVLAALFTLALGLLIWQLDLPNWQRLDLGRIKNLPETTLVYDVHGDAMGSLYAAQNGMEMSDEQRTLLSGMMERIWEGDA